MKRHVIAVVLYWLVAGSAIVVLSLCAASIAHGTISDCHDATCRISTGSARGTGCVFEISQGHVYVLTNAHVVGSAATVECEFFKHGHQSQPVRGRVILRSDSVDAAVVAVPATALGGVLPAAVPLADRRTLLRLGETVLSVGCAHGGWATGWKGHVLGYQGGDLHFVPTPANGRSGSAIFDAAGERIVGLLRARTMDERQGIAVSVQSLHRAFGAGRPTAGDAGRNAPCPSGGCFPFGRGSQPDRKPDGYAWPTLPPQSVAPGGSVDLAPIAGKLDKITELLIEMKAQSKAINDAGQLPGRPLAPVPPPAAADAAAKVAEEVRRESSRLREAVETLIGDRETLHERFEARLAKVKEELGEDASRPQVARAYVEDFLKEKLADGTLGLTGGKILGGALGLSGPLALALGGGLWLLSRRIGAKLEAGDPLLIQRLIERLGDKLDDVKERVRDLPAAGATAKQEAK